MSPSKDKKSRSQSKRTASKKIPVIDLVVTVFFVIALTLFIFWSSQDEPKNFGLQPLKTSTIFALPIKPSSDKSHQENFGIKGKINGLLRLGRPVEGSFELTFTGGILINEVFITTPYSDSESIVNILHRGPIEVNSVISVTLETAYIDMGIYPTFELHSSAQNFEFSYDENRQTTSEGFNLFIEDGNSTIQIDGFAEDSITTNDGFVNGVYIINLYGVKQIRFGDEVLVTPEDIAFVVVPDRVAYDDYHDNFQFDLISNFTDLRHYPDNDNPKIDIQVFAPIIKLLDPSGTLIIGTEKQELSSAFDAVTIIAADNPLTANIKSEMGIYESLIEGKSNSIIVNGVEKINSRWQTLGSDWRIIVGTFFTSVLLFVLQKIYQFFKNEKAL